MPATQLSERHNEFREMVKRLHQAGIEVILDVVYNHTCEGDEHGPTYTFKGIDNTTYYLLSDDPNHPFVNFSGTGNTLHTANRAVRQLIVDSLRYWVKEMHVDGFRFDLALVLTRNEDGSPNTEDPPIFGQILGEPDFANLRLIAEPWDAAGVFQLGSRFPGQLWMQWNARFRDTVQRFCRGDSGLVHVMITAGGKNFALAFMKAARAIGGASSILPYRARRISVTRQAHLRVILRTIWSVPGQWLS